MLFRSLEKRQVEAVRGLQGTQAAGEMRDRFVGLERDDLRQMRVVGDEGRHRSLGDIDQLRVGVAAPQRPDERRGEQDVADGAEANEEDAQHAGQCSPALPGFASGTNFSRSMQRPKSILWIDDEVEGLAAHRRFLEGQGFAVEQAAHGEIGRASCRERVSLNV